MIELSQFESAVNFLESALFEFLVNGTERFRNGSRHEAAAPHHVYRCAGDDRWCAITVFTEQEWFGLCQATGHPERCWRGRPTRRSWTQR
jgi:benzylsuccinate CoA-transferase BbsF subunit